jgi:hypothetical protein
MDLEASQGGGLQHMTRNRKRVALDLALRKARSLGV